MSDLLSGEQPLVPPADAQVIALDRRLDLEAVTRIERSAVAASPARTLIDLSTVSMVGSAELAVAEPEKTHHQRRQSRVDARRQEALALGG